MFRCEKAIFREVCVQRISGCRYAKHKFKNYVQDNNILQI